MSKKSPFPGMDPWLEDHWGDVHARLTTYTSDFLQPGLPSGLRARIEEYVTIEAKDEGCYPRHRLVPDVSITERPSFHERDEQTAVATLPEVEAIELPRLVEEPTLRRVQIVDTRSGHRVITSIEFLSPSNKLGRGLEEFRQKQNEFLDGGVNLVEIDLIRTGEWAMSVRRGLVPEDIDMMYRAVVIRANNQLMCDFYPISVTKPLPKIRVPLRPKDQDVILDLQPLLDLAYINGGYAEEIDYSRQPLTPLIKPIADWTQAWLEKSSQNN